MTSGLSGITPAMGAALTGIRGSIERFNAASAEVSRAATVGASEIGAGPDTVSFSGTARAKLDETRDPRASLERGLIDQGLAAHDLAASVRVMKTADEMMVSLLAIRGPHGAR